MHLLIDSADTVCWKSIVKTGLFSGVTTNPLLIQRAGLPVSMDTYSRLYDAAMTLGFHAIHFQVWGDDWLATGDQIAGLGPETRVKVPANRLGFEVVTALDIPHRTTLTAVYTAGQVMAAEALKVAYAAPYYARLKEAGANADQIFDDMQHIASTTTLLIASLRSSDEVISLATRGFSTFALPETLALKVFESPLAESSINAFEEAAR